MNQKTKFKQTEIGMIPEDWEVVEFLDYIELRHGHQFRQYDFKKEGIRVLKITQIKEDGSLDLSDCSYVDASRVEEFKDILIKKGDILMALTGATIGKIARVKEDYGVVLQNYRVGNFIPINKDKLSKDYLYFFLCSNFFLNQMLARITQSAQQNIGKEEINNMTFVLPPLSEQDRISNILSCIENKIYLNQQISKTLESIGQAIFKHWFVDFEFPNEKGEPYKSSSGEMVDSELGKIPEGWKVKPIDEIADFLNGLALQKFPAQEDEEYLPIIKIRELRQGITESSDKANLSIPEEYIVDDGDILFSWSGSLEVVIWTFGKGALNQHLFKVSSKDYPKWFYYYWVLEHLTEYRHIAEGKATTMGHIQRHHLKSSLVLVPDKQTIIKMDKVLTPIISKIIQMNIESRNLSQIRDSLLPKLMSGKIRVTAE